MTTSHDLATLAARRLRHYLGEARAIPTLARRLPGAHPWSADIRLVSDTVIRRLNLTYRRKDYATDVLSFPAPDVFREGAGLLGEIVIGTGVLKRQAREQGHKPERELEVLIVHGILHLLGFDHELGPRQAAEMARWEAKLLKSKAATLKRPARGLIARARSGKS